MGESTWHPASDVKTFNVDRYDFLWSEDFTKFRAVPFTWRASDDLSPVPVEPPPPVIATIPPPPNDDDLPY